MDEWLRSVLWENELPGDDAQHQTAFEIHRIKGRLALEGGNTKIIQGVRELFEIFDAPASAASLVDGASQTGKVVLIGRHVTNFDFEKSLLAAVKSV